MRVLKPHLGASFDPWTVFPGQRAADQLTPSTSLRGQDGAMPGAPLQRANDTGPHTFTQMIFLACDSLFI